MTVGAVAAVVGVLLLGRATTGGGSDVGDLEAFAPVQAALRPVDICKLDYMTRRTGVNQDKPERVRIVRCTNELMPSWTYLSVPAAFTQRGLSFNLSRSSRADRFRIEVDKGTVPFDELVAGLSVLAPDIAARYPAARARQESEERAAKEQLDRSEAERERARKQSRESYPSR